MAQALLSQDIVVLTFLAVAMLFLVVGLMAACLPALRASRVDPLVALRHD